MAGSKTRSLCLKLVCLITIYLRPLLSFVSYILRLQGNDSNSLNKKIDFIELPLEDKAENDVTEFRDLADEAEEEEKQEEVYLKFKFPTYEEFCQIEKETGNIFNSEVVPSESTSKYEPTSGKSFIANFIDDSEEVETFPVNEINDNIIENFSENEKGFSDGNSVHEKGKEIVEFNGEKNEKTESMEFGEKSEEKCETVQEEDESDFLPENFSGITNSDSESTGFERIRDVMKGIVDSYSDGFLSERDFEGELDESEQMDSDVFDENDDSSEAFDDEDSDILEELKKLEEDDQQKSDFLRDKDFDEDLDNINDAELLTNDGKGVINGDNSEKTRSNDSSLVDNGDTKELESLWEHQELIEQLKMELKKVRATGLPTILEDSESPKIMDDLKPWKIDDLHRENCIGELHRFYKSYRERMRKFDIVNYQKMYAMGFLQLNDPLQSISKQRSSPPTLKSLVSQNLWLFKHKIHGSDPMKKFIKELEGDLEAVYVGHMCLSWEFLHWQYEKALDLWDSDPRGIRQYNEVAGEFQQFQVLMQRFIEDEPFQGPRVQNYVKSRCLVRNLLQVPVIREDKSKDQRKARRKDGDEYVITSDTLVEIVEESIRIFWRFVRADKDCTTSAVNSHKKIPELPASEDLKLLMEIRKVLQKKERKLKDILRGENCILRKFRRCRDDDDSDQVLYFFSQVDMKLVSRVLNMSKITRDQLIWCHNKLNRISFVNRRIHVEPAFLLFPC
ncbi:hypothetical protein CDL12_02782 [Handroanthus impetiginosus]|uniref:Ribosomal protein L34Ae n=1 Tax=Handroanthus impetiginosus TaxID=429701 RepID=A0A2G9I416_9LAMI|nr:hypothetical protein CDL12_02782 [Handroanthus impetiginosus]